MNPSSMSRIQRLKKEIAEIDQKLESATERPTVSPLQVSHQLQISSLNFKKTQERDETQQRINSLRVSASKEDSFNSQLTEIQQKLRSLGKQKQIESQNSKYSRDPLLQKASVLKETIRKLHEDYQTMSASTTKKQKLKESQQQGKLLAYQDSLAPLEAESTSLIKRKQQMQHRQEQLSDEIQRIENSIQMCKEELDSRFINRAEYIGQREEDEEALEQLRLEFADELEYFDEEFEVIDQLSVLNRQKEDYIEKMQRLEWKLAEMTRNVMDIRNKIEESKDAICNIYSSTPNMKDQQEIEKLETFINIKCQNYEIENLGDVIMKLNCNDRFDIEEEILRIQLKEMMKQQTRMNEEWETKESLITEKLKGEEDEEIVYRLESELYESQQKYRNRIAAIEQ